MNPFVPRPCELNFPPARLRLTPKAGFVDARSHYGCIISLLRVTSTSSDFDDTSFIEYTNACGLNTNDRAFNVFHAQNRRFTPKSGSKCLNPTLVFMHAGAMSWKAHEQGRHMRGSARGERDIEAQHVHGEATVTRTRTGTGTGTGTEGLVCSLNLNDN